MNYAQCHNKDVVLTHKMHFKNTVLSRASRQLVPYKSCLLFFLNKTLTTKPVRL